MRLTDKLRKEFVDGVLNDLAHVDYHSMAEDILRKDVEAQRPQTIKALIADPLIEPYIGDFYVRSTAAGVFNGIKVKCAYNIKPSKECDKQLIDLQKQFNDQYDKRKALRAELFGSISKCRSTQQISKLFPELSKYLPKDPWEPAENPPALNVIQHLVDAGWPASERQ